MYGAEAVVGTLADCGVAACFANPGTSEMHLVTALDREPRIRSVLCLFEGVATGAADGYGRMAGKPAMTLLHLGSGYCNGGANIHNARRGRSPMVNVIGDHATYHLQYDAPLTSDVPALVRPNVLWCETVPTKEQAGALAAQAYAASMRGIRGPVGLILPADCAWEEGAARAQPLPLTLYTAPDPERVETVAKAVRTAKKPAILMNGTAALNSALSARLEAAGVKMLLDTFLWRQSRGAGAWEPMRLPYFGEMALAALDGVDLLVLAGTQPPAAFFAYPNKPGLLVPDGCAVETLVDAHGDSDAALLMLAEALGAPAAGPVTARQNFPEPKGVLDASTVAMSIARHMPEGAVVCDDGVTSGLAAHQLTVGAAPHEWLAVAGGAIGGGAPMAVGVAIACPDRKVISLGGDGAFMYTNQALWTMARENLDVITIIYANRSYRILNIELARTGAGNPGPVAHAMLSLDNPTLDFVKLAQSQGVEAARCTTAEEFDRVFAGMIAQKGPKLIEAVI
jgi:acetolactate synthase-1/2/3 large subunit